LLNVKIEKMRRNEFFTVLGISAGTVIFAPFLVSCSKSSTLPADPGTGGTGGVDFTLDLTLPANSALTTVGGSLLKSGIIIAHTAAGYVAVASACTHAGYVVGFDNSNNRFHCQNPDPGHGSNYATNGSVINGPATAALKSYNIQLTNTSLRVYG